MNNQEEEVINFFNPTKPFGELSNFWILKIPIVFKHKCYPTSEHLYQSLKYIYFDNPPPSLENEEYAEIIRKAKTPNMAKILANRKLRYKYDWEIQLNNIIKKYEDKGIVFNELEWEKNKVIIMKKVLRLKFSTDEKAKHILLSTKNAKLRENSPFDKFWGYYNGEGQNMLGKLLEEIREEFLLVQKERMHLKLNTNNEADKKSLNNNFLIINNRLISKKEDEENPDFFYFL